MKDDFHRRSDSDVFLFGRCEIDKKCERRRCGTGLY